ncbi:hypothetical protein OSTOST_15105, partial [Ostertagia ostertagi]
ALLNTVSCATQLTSCANEKNQCHLECSRELLFNRLQSELCIEILHGNRTVGSAKFTKKSIDFKSSKATEFLTRPTKLSLYHTKRCATTRSCQNNKCETIKQNETGKLQNILATGCMNSCGGIFCGCGPSFWFYKIAHRPISDRIFEITQCPHWTTTVKLEIEQSFTPYVATNIDRLTLIQHNNNHAKKIQRPCIILEKRVPLQIHKDKAYFLAPNFRIAIACNTPTQAMREFSTCSNIIQCKWKFAHIVSVRTIRTKTL